MEDQIEYQLLTFTKRLRVMGVVDTMAQQVPEVTEAFRELQEKMSPKLVELDRNGWMVISHTHSIYNGILIVSVMARRTNHG